ncbi:MAG TPA: AEC family transporter, partial [Opitutaceae bacterium]
MTIGELFRLILPVFALIGVGVALRRFHWIEGAAETSLLKLVVYVCMPCLVFDTVIGNASLTVPGNLLFPPLAGFLTTAVGFGVAYLAGRMIRLESRSAVRTFAFSAGIANYSYLPLPIVGALWGAHAQGVVMVHNLGVDTALWSVGLVVLTGASPHGGWKRL